MTFGGSISDAVLRLYRLGDMLVGEDPAVRGMCLIYLGHTGDLDGDGVVFLLWVLDDETTGHLIEETMHNWREHHTKFNRVSCVSEAEG